MAYYDPSSSRNYKPSRRRDSFTPTSPPNITPGGMPRTSRVSTRNYAYAHSPPRPSSPPSFYAEKKSYYDTPKARAAHAKNAPYDEYDIPSSPPPSFRAERGSYYDTPKARAAHARNAAYDEYDIPSSPPPSFRPEKGSYYDSPKSPAAHSQSHFQSHPNSRFGAPPSSSSSSPPPPQNPITDTSPTPYTYSDDEPTHIPIAPMPWNNYSSSTTKEELINFFIDEGYHPRRAAAAVDREFAAYAPQYLAGTEGPGMPRVEVPASGGGGRGGSEGWGGSGQRSARTRRHSPPPSAYRSPSPVPGNGSRHRSSSASGSGSGSSWKYRAHSPPRRSASRREGEKREIWERDERTMTPPRAPSPPPAAMREEVKRMRRWRGK